MIHWHSMTTFIQGWNMRGSSSKKVFWLNRETWKFPEMTSGGIKIWPQTTWTLSWSDGAILVWYDEFFLILMVIWIMSDQSRSLKRNQFWSSILTSARLMFTSNNKPYQNRTTVYQNLHVPHYTLEPRCELRIKYLKTRTIIYLNLK